MREKVKLILTNCNDGCHCLDSGGGMAELSGEFYCEHMGAPRDENGKYIEFDAREGIPDWCPLPGDDEEVSVCRCWDCGRRPYDSDVCEAYGVSLRHFAGRYECEDFEPRGFDDFDDDQEMELDAKMEAESQRRAAALVDEISDLLVGLGHKVVRNDTKIILVDDFEISMSVQTEAACGNCCINHRLYCVFAKAFDRKVSYHEPKGGFVPEKIVERILYGVAQEKKAIDES